MVDMSERSAALDQAKEGFPVYETFIPIAQCH